MRNSKLIGIALIVVSASADASEWLVVKTLPDVVVSVDLSTIEHSKGLAKIWERDEFTPPRQDRLARPTKSTKVHALFDCKRRLRVVGALVAYDADGNVLMRTGPVSPPLEIIPDSLADNVMSIACNQTGNHM